MHQRRLLVLGPSFWAIQVRHTYTNRQSRSVEDGKKEFWTILKISEMAWQEWSRNHQINLELKQDEKRTLALH